MDLTRGGFLRLGAAGVATARGRDARRWRGARCAPAGHAAGRRRRLPDLRRRGRAHARWPSTRQALTTPGLFDAAERRRLTQARDGQARPRPAAQRGARRRTPSAPSDYEVDFPKTAFASRRSAVALGDRAREAARRRLRQRRRLIGRPGHAPAPRPAAHRRRPAPRPACATMNGKPRSPRPAHPARHRAGRRRPRQAPHRPRLAGRRLIMRRTTLAVLVAVAPSRCSCAGRRARRSTSTRPPR